MVNGLIALPPDTALSRIPIFWTMLLSILVVVYIGFGHVAFFPCVYFYILSMGKTAHQHFFLLECKSCKCRIITVKKEVVVDEADIRDSLSELASAHISSRQHKHSWNNLRIFLCTKTPPRLVVHEPEHVFDINSLNNPSTRVLASQLQLHGNGYGASDNSLGAPNNTQTRECCSCCPCLSDEPDQNAEPIPRSKWMFWRRRRRERETPASPFDLDSLESSLSYKTDVMHD